MVSPYGSFIIPGLVMFNPADAKYFQRFLWHLLAKVFGDDLLRCVVGNLISVPEILLGYVGAAASKSVIVGG